MVEISHSHFRNFSPWSEFKCVGASEETESLKELTLWRNIMTNRHGAGKGRLTMKYFRYVALLAVLALPLAYGQAEVRVGVGIGFGPGYVAGPPVCAYGYYPDYPYTCAPYGYYGPSWFANGIFIGAGPWYHGWGYSYYGRSFYGRRDYDRHYYGRGYEGRDFDGRHFEGRGDQGRHFEGRGFEGRGPASGFHGEGGHGGGFHGGRR
jgi:hypothetical protein